ncbi:hypothetical protein CY0110_18162 [Crocosphaera chwakensis CCY0110]|uniref:Uncharacterized protein n=1 Tax=Crocosphaera chwakensis CCY0110 TaxID=391612 RepID=A3IIW4_9CHRO|nr:hypothetical protein CY0110_18162 [Crocosphaera chwakensis CCY0110]
MENPDDELEDTMSAQDYRGMLEGEEGI